MNQVVRNFFRLLDENWVPASTEFVRGDEPADVANSGLEKTTHSSSEKSRPNHQAHQPDAIARLGATKVNVLGKV
jgi:hypothetical protein